MAMKGDAKSLSFVEDTAVAPEKLRDYIEQFLQMVRNHGTTAGVYAHASVGCLHVRPVINIKTEAGVRQFESIASASADLVLAFGGALSGEHGDGLVRGPFIQKMFGPVLYEAFRHIKRTFDPDGIFNPGKIVDTPPLTDNLRYGPAYRAQQPATFFDYADYGGLPGAVEMCSGLGACRKTLDGTMCPSYMATRDEAHSTRGRANVLRLAMAGRIGDAGLGDEGVRQVLDLCLECRACKAECPVGVDVARFKSEFLAEYLAAARDAASSVGARQRSRHVTMGKPVGPALELGRPQLAGPVAQRVATWPRSQEAASRLGADDVCAAVRPVTTPRRFGPPSHGFRQDAEAAGQAVIFNDTFTNYYSPSIGIAGAEVLRAAGFDVILAPVACCGRPMISQGFLAAARRQAAVSTDRLYPVAQNGQPIVFFEPSCLSAIREDVPSLLRGEARRRAQVIADRSMLFEDLLGSHWSSLPETFKLRRGPSRVLLHGHCHQKAMGRLATARTLLDRIPGSTVIDLDAGCCGMAGSFGYVKDHFEVSRAIGERRLLPAVRDMGPDSTLVASGTSCRHQVADFSGVRALHPAELIRSLLSSQAPPRDLA